MKKLKYLMKLLCHIEISIILYKLFLHDLNYNYIQSFAKYFVKNL